MSVLVALDAGTGGGKAAVFDLQGRLLGRHVEPWTYSVRPRADLPMIREYGFDPDRFWSLLSHCCRSALARAGCRPEQVAGVATTSQREGCVFLDAGGHEIYAGPNLDTRGFIEGMEILAALGARRLYEITGHSAPFIFPAARYLYFRKNDTRTVARILMINDWMTYRLCGEPSAEPSNASESMLFDFRARRWSAEILDLFQIPEAVLPPLYSPGERVGAVSAEAASATGLRAGTPVFMGGADTQCSLLGAGVVEPGEVGVILGTTTPIQAVVAAPTLDPMSNLWAGCHVVPERWVIEANVGASGDAYDWLLGLLVPDGADRYARAEEMARAADDDATFTFIGPRIFDLTKIRPDLPGGIFFRFPAMQLRPSAGDLLRAFLDSLAFAIRSNLTLLEAVLGAPPSCLVAGGGMTRSRLLLRILADVTGLTVRSAAEPECTGLGVAILAATGAGLHPDLATAVKAMCRQEEVRPDPEMQRRYEGSFAKWRELYDALDTLAV